MSEGCPKCGAELCWHGYSSCTGIRKRETTYHCGTRQLEGCEPDEGRDCLRRQLAAAQARIAELEAYSVEALPVGGWLSFEDGVWSSQYSDNDLWCDGDTPAEAIRKAREAATGEDDPQS